MKNEAPEAKKINQIGTWSRLGGSWSGSWRPGRDFLGISAQVGAKMGARWAKLGPSWQQVAPKMGHDSAKMAIFGLDLGGFGSILGLFWHMGCIAENLQKLKENIIFLVFESAWRGAVTRKSGLEQSWEILGHLLACCAHLLKVSAQVGAKMGAR